jgi:PAS domain S-box-containing protein
MARSFLSDRTIRPYLLVVLGVAAATIVRLPLEPLLHGRAPYAFYYLPILWFGWNAGVGSTILATLLSLAASWIFIIPLEPGDLATIPLFLIVSTALVLLARSARSMRDAQYFLGSVVESSDDAIVTKDLDGIVQSWNRGTERLFGYAPREIIGQPILVLIPPEHQHEEHDILRRLRRGERIDHFETVRLTKDRRNVDVSITISPVRNRLGEIIGASKIARDISDRKRAAEEREHLLEAERNARNEAELANRSKDEFVAMVSHELRTPLNAILGWTQILKANPRHDDEKLKKGLEVIERNARAQEKVVSDLLDMSRIISGKLRLDVSDVDLIALIKTTVEATRPAADAKGISVDCTLDPSVAATIADPARLEQCLWNLLSNAIKFTPQGGHVTVSLRRAGSHVELSVADNGLGISSDFLPFVFDRFRQLDGATRRTAGLGLGLAIVKQLAELHGGYVRAESAGEGKGSTFTLALPVRALRTKPSARRPISDRPAQLDRVRVLLVEDEADNREVLRTLLEQHHALVTVAGSAHEALKIMPNVRPNIVVSDIGLPDIDGYEFVQRIREGDVAPERIPAIALTAHASPEDRTKALRAGFQAHIAKPVEPNELIATIASLTGLMGDRTPPKTAPSPAARLR